MQNEVIKISKRIYEGICDADVFEQHQADMYLRQRDSSVLDRFYRELENGQGMRV